MKEKIQAGLPWLFLALFALSRWPGLFPPSFSAAYALAFCAGVYFRGATAWWLPMTTMLATDIALNFYYQHKYPGGKIWDLPDLANLALNYAAYAALIFLGQRFKATASFFKLLGGGILGAILFYLVTNTASWLFNPFNDPEYTKTLAGWLLALTKGTGGFPPTWEFFRNTLLSGGLFTALFVAAEKMASAESPADKTAGAHDEESEETPEEAGA